MKSVYGIIESSKLVAQEIYKDGNTPIVIWYLEYNGLALLSGFVIPECTWGISQDGLFSVIRQLNLLPDLSDSELSREVNRATDKIVEKRLWVDIDTKTLHLLDIKTNISAK